MQYRKFGRTGLTVSRLCLGTMTFGLQTEEACFAPHPRHGRGRRRELHRYRQCLSARRRRKIGRTHRGDRRTLAEGQTRPLHSRDQGGRQDGAAAWDQGASRKHLLDAIDASLRRLGTDYVDLYQLHSDDANTPLDETLEALDVIVRSGKARYIGVSNFLAYRLARALGRADVLRVARFVSVQPRYNLLFRRSSASCCRWRTKSNWP